MKTRIIFLVLISIIFGSCKEKNPKVFNEDLLKAILEAKDSLNIKDDELLSIQFYNQDRYERRCMMKVFSLNYYASGEISAFTKIGNTTVAIYNIKDDIYESINKNEITFFIDTIKGYKDCCMLPQLNKKIFYHIKSDMVKKITYPFNDFPIIDLLRKPRCKGGISFTPPESEWFRLDSLQAEKEVEYYRNKGKKHNE